METEKGQELGEGVSEGKLTCRKRNIVFLLLDESDEENWCSIL
jgi:hypothetical protein